MATKDGTAPRAASETDAAPDHANAADADTGADEGDADEVDADEADEADDEGDEVEDDAVEGDAVEDDEVENDEVEDDEVEDDEVEGGEPDSEERGVEDEPVDDEPAGDEGAEPRESARERSNDARSKRPRRARGSRAARTDAAIAETPPPELPAPKKLSQRKARSIERRVAAIVEDNEQLAETITHSAVLLQVRARLALLGTETHTTQALRSTELSLRRMSHELTSTSIALDSGVEGVWYVRTDPQRGVVRFGADGEIDLTHPTRNAHVRLRLLSEPGRRYLIEFEASGAGAGRFQVIDTLASTERKFASGDPHIAFVHEHPGDAPAWTSLILVSAHARWMFRRAMVTTLN